MSLTIRPYHDQDYDAIKALYLQSELYGGQFDPAKDSRERMRDVTQKDPESILVHAGNTGLIQGTISLIENGRVGWLFRFAVARCDDEKEIAQALYRTACAILEKRGHTQFLVYAPLNDERLAQRYRDLGMVQGGDYTCFWTEI